MWLIACPQDNSIRFEPTHNNYIGYLRLSGIFEWNDVYADDPDLSANPDIYTCSIDLYPGWNLISVPVGLTNYEQQVTNFFPPYISCHITDIWQYDGCIFGRQAWVYYSPLNYQYIDFPTQSAIQIISPYRGYWVYYNGYAKTSFSVTGYATHYATIPISDIPGGWFLIGHPTASPVNTGSLYSGANDVWGYSNQFWSYYSGQRFGSNGGANPLYIKADTMQPGQAYWVFTNGDSNPANMGIPPQVPLSTSGITPPAQPVPDSPGAQLVSISMPQSVNVGQYFYGSVTFSNNGRIPWSQGTQICLSSDSSQAALFGDTFVIPGDIIVLPEQTYTFNIRLTAPTTAGTYYPTWRMVMGDNQYFGDPATATIVVNPAPYYSAHYLADNIPTQMTTGQTTTNVWIRLENSGTLPWTEGSRIPAVHR